MGRGVKKPERWMGHDGIKPERWVGKRSHEGGLGVG